MIIRTVGLAIVFVDINWDPFFIYRNKNDGRLFFLVGTIQISKNSLGQSNKYDDRLSFESDYFNNKYLSTKKHLTCLVKITQLQS